MRKYWRSHSRPNWLKDKVKVRYCASNAVPPFPNRWCKHEWWYFFFMKNILQKLLQMAWHSGMILSNYLVFIFSPKRKSICWPKQHNCMPCYFVMMFMGKLSCYIALLFKHGYILCFPFIFLYLFFLPQVSIWKSWGSSWRKSAASCGRKQLNT